MEQISEIIVTALLVIAGIFGLVGSFGLIKLRDTMQRLHAPTKATTLGVGGVLIASMIYFYAERGTITFHELLISLFLFLTSPITANFIAKTYMARRLAPEDLPKPASSDFGWSIHDAPPTEAEVAIKPE